MTPEQIAIVAGILALGVPALLIAALALRRNTPVRLFAYALILVGIGYLVATGTAQDIGTVLLGKFGMVRPARA